MKYKCQGCDRMVDEGELDRDTFAPEICHPIRVGEGNGWWTEPCGPVDAQPEQE